MTNKLKIITLLLAVAIATSCNKTNEVLQTNTNVTNTHKTRTLTPLETEITNFSNTMDAINSNTYRGTITNHTVADATYQIENCFNFFYTVLGAPKNYVQTTFKDSFNVTGIGSTLSILQVNSIFNSCKAKLRERKLSLSGTYVYLKLADIEMQLVGSTLTVKVNSNFTTSLAPTPPTGGGTIAFSNATDCYNIKNGYGKLTNSNKNATSQNGTVVAGLGAGQMLKQYYNINNPAGISLYFYTNVQTGVCNGAATQWNTYNFGNNPNYLFNASWYFTNNSFCNIATQLNSTYNNYWQAPWIWGDWMNYYLTNLNTVIPAIKNNSFYTWVPTGNTFFDWDYVVFQGLGTTPPDPNPTYYVIQNAIEYKHGTKVPKIYTPPAGYPISYANITPKSL